MSVPHVQTLEPRRLLTALVGADVGWGRDGVVSRSEQNVYLGRVGRGFYTRGAPFGNDYRDVSYRVQRYSDAGRLAASFVVPGRRDFSEFDVDDQGRILVTGLSTPDGNAFTVRRFTAAGRADASFGKNGAATGFGSGYVDLATNRSGEVYLIGQTARIDGKPQQGLISKLRSDGTPDPAFGDGGTVVLPGSLPQLGSTFTRIDQFVGIDRAGRILAATGTSIGPKAKFVVTRLLPDGTFDRTYGRDGTFSAAFHVDVDQDDARIALDSRGRLVVSESFSKSSGTVVGKRLRRITEDGQLDSKFGIKGDAATTLTGQDFVPNSLILMPDGTISALLGTSFWRLGDDGLPLRGRGPALARGVVTGLVGVTRNGALFGRSPNSRGETVTRLATLEPAEVGRNGRLYLYGDDGDDSFRLRRGSSDNELYVDHNGTRVGVFRDVVSVNADLRAGDDVLLDRYLPNTRDLPMTVSGGDGRDSIYTGAGDDQISPGTGDDTVYAGPGDDFVSNSFVVAVADKDVYDLGSGDDTANDVYGPVTVYGGAGDDTIRTGAAADRLYGGDGADEMLAGHGNNVVYGDAGNDRITARVDNDRLFGGVGDDTIDAGRGDDRVYGNDFDTPDAPTARNVLIGGAGADRVRRESDDDELDGFEAELT
ncbi:MAG TPA: hypothetical protein VF595_14865 [Tepidisphaeraceae bacterium]|jgi:uncharacterized delta-60 repeat protein